MGQPRLPFGQLTQGRMSSSCPANEGEIIRLFLMKTAFNDESLRELANLKSPELLNVRETRVTDAGVAELQKALPKLQVLR